MAVKALSGLVLPVLLRCASSPTFSIQNLVLSVMYSTFAWALGCSRTVKVQPGTMPRMWPWPLARKPPWRSACMRNLARWLPCSSVWLACLSTPALGWL
jgi:hypothetical protein